MQSKLTFRDSPQFINVALRRNVVVSETGVVFGAGHALVRHIEDVLLSVCVLPLRCCAAAGATYVQRLSASVVIPEAVGLDRSRRRAARDSSSPCPSGGGQPESVGIRKSTDEIGFRVAILTLTFGTLSP